MSKITLPSFVTSAKTLTEAKFMLCITGKTSDGPHSNNTCVIVVGTFFIMNFLSLIKSFNLADGSQVESEEVVSHSKVFIACLNDGSEV